MYRIALCWHMEGKNTVICSLNLQQPVRISGWHSGADFLLMLVQLANPMTHSAVWWRRAPMQLHFPSRDTI